MSKGNKESVNVETNVEDWREPATQDDDLPYQSVDVVMFDPRASLIIKAHEMRKNADTKNGVKIKTSDGKEIDRE